MTAHELAYYRYLLSELKRLYTESQAKSVMLDSWNTYGREGVRASWRTDVAKMAKDPLFRSAVEANHEPYFAKVQRGLQDAAAFNELVGTSPPKLDGQSQ